MIRLAALLSLCLAAPVMAGPYDVLHLRDALIGVSADRVFLLRRASDNMASYFQDMQTIALIEIDRSTGEETVWPVSRAQYGTDMSRIAGPDSMSAYDLPDAVDPFARLAEQGAVALLVTVGPPLTEQPKITWGAGDTHFMTWRDDPNHPPDAPVMPASVHTGGADGWFSETLARFTGKMDYQRNGPVSFAYIPDPRFFGIGDCGIPSFWGIRSGPDDSFTALQRFECEQPDGHSATLIRLLPTR